MIKNSTTSQKQKLNNARGFTLVETLVAITILIVTIVGPFYAVSKSITASYTARDKLIAAALAQEGVEYIRAIRDNNYLANYNAGVPVYNWIGGVDGSTDGTHNVDCITNACLVDPPQNSILVCSGACTLALAVNASNLYVQSPSGATPTKFVRSVQIATVPGGGNPTTATEVTVTVTVTFTTAGIPYSVQVVDHLYNWL
jgi:prepilin-type N-terminal cleavage/methylation domain-containing protein